MKKALVCVLAAVALAGCAITNETSVVVGKVRPATAPDQVKLYTKPPAKYEDVALVSADAAHDFMSKQELMNISIAKLKAEAAKVGANGILLDNVGDLALGSSGIAMAQPLNRKGAAMAWGSSTNRTGKQASGMAIYVTEE